MPTRTRNRMRARSIAFQANEARRDFLQIDSQVGLTFSSIALTATDAEKKRRTTRTARKAYDTIMRLRNGIDLSDEENDKLERNLDQLKSELLTLGENF